jgi:hypothetical protein
VIWKGSYIGSGDTSVVSANTLCPIIAQISGNCTQRSLKSRGCPAWLTERQDTIAIASQDQASYGHIRHAAVAPACPPTVQGPLPTTRVPSRSSERDLCCVYIASSRDRAASWIDGTMVSLAGQRSSHSMHSLQRLATSATVLHCSSAAGSSPYLIR